MYKTNPRLSPSVRLCGMCKTNPGLSRPTSLCGCTKRTRNPRRPSGCAEFAKRTCVECTKRTRDSPHPARLRGMCETNPSRVWQVADLGDIQLNKAKGKRILRNNARLGLTGGCLWHFFSQGWAPRIRRISLRLNCSSGRELFRRLRGAGRWLRGLDAVGCKDWKRERRLVTGRMTDGCRSRLTRLVEKGAKPRQKWRSSVLTRFPTVGPVCLSPRLVKRDPSPLVRVAKKVEQTPFRDIELRAVRKSAFPACNYLKVKL